jgi:hypothetical protein
MLQRSGQVRSCFNMSSLAEHAANLRVGKSTFLQEDMIPEIVRRDWLPVYVDLWAR